MKVWITKAGYIFWLGGVFHDFCFPEFAPYKPGKLPVFVWREIGWMVLE